MQPISISLGYIWLVDHLAIPAAQKAAEIVSPIAPRTNRQKDVLNDSEKNPTGQKNQQVTDDCITHYILCSIAGMIFWLCLNAMMRPNGKSSGTRDR